MDPSKLIPTGSLRIHAVFTLKEKGDVTVVKEDMRQAIEATHGESGFISGEPFLKEGETEEDATEIHVISLWKSQAALDSHLEEQHVKQFFDKHKDRIASFVIDKFSPLLQ